ncbi:MAG: rod shape-determining protein MreC [Bacteroidota bacterium]
MTSAFWMRLRDWGTLLLCLAASTAFMVARNEPLTVGLRALALDATAWVESRFSGVTYFIQARSENERLTQLNIDLANELAISRGALEENARLRAMLDMADTLAVPHVPARVVDKDITRQQNFITIDRGRRDGVAVDMAVLTPEGIIGRVHTVGERYAQVMTYLHTNYRIPARLLDIGADGILSWSGQRRDRLSLDYIPITETVTPGMKVVTNGYSQVFPPGFVIGEVDTVRVRPGQNDLDIDLIPASPITRVQYVFVLFAQPDTTRRFIPTN